MNSTFRLYFGCKSQISSFNIPLVLSYAWCVQSSEGTNQRSERKKKVMWLTIPPLSLGMSPPPPHFIFVHFA